MDGKDNYSAFLVVIKWILGVVELGGGVYIMMKFHEMIGMAYGAYAAAAFLIILPLSTCIGCCYYGKRCHCGWGALTRYAYKIGESVDFARAFSWRVLIHPVWAVPLLGALFNLARLRRLEPAIVFGAFALVVFINHRLLMKHPACKHCLQRFNCPGCQYQRYVRIKPSDI